MTLNAEPLYMSKNIFCVKTINKTMKKIYLTFLIGLGKQFQLCQKISKLGHRNPSKKVLHYSLG